MKFLKENIFGANIVSVTIKEKNSCSKVQIQIFIIIISLIIYINNFFLCYPLIIVLSTNHNDEEIKNLSPKIKIYVPHENQEDFFYYYRLIFSSLTS